MMHTFGYYGFGWIGMILGLVIFVAVVVGIVLLVVWAVRKGSGSNKLAATGELAQDIAKMRYARGEITREEYQQLLSDLK